MTRTQDKVNVCAYADDFIVTGATRDVLEWGVKPAIDAFLCERGLTLSKAKTRITHIDEGLEFLGMAIRKYRGKLLITPSKKGVKRLLADIRAVIKRNATAKRESLIYQLNPKLRGWAYYYRHVCSKRTFSYIDHQVFRTLWCWAKRRHPNKSHRWIKQKYFRNQGNRHWVFSTKSKDTQGNRFELDLMETSKVAIKRHIKIRASAQPYDPFYQEYFRQRQRGPNYRVP